MDKLHVCIVDDHCDVVPFFHAFWRATKIPSHRKAQLVHFDAHPDLSIPSTRKFTNTTGTWQDPESLYDILGEEGGIAEFILPMCTTGLLSSIAWLRSPWSRQLADGRVEFQLKDMPGERSSSRANKKARSDVPCSSSVEPVVSLRAPYYIDEGVYACQECFKSCGGTASHIIDVTTALCSTLTPNTSIVWVLDICLDYFSTQNPFLVDLIASLESDVLSLSAALKDGLESLLGAVQVEDPCCDNPDASNATEIVRCAFQHLAYRCCTEASLNYALKMTEEESCECGALKKARQHSQDVIGRLLCSDTVTLEAKSEYLSLYDRECVHHGELFLALLPSLSSQTRSIIVKAQTLLLLPHHRSSEAEIESLLLEMESWLRECLTQHGTRPLFVTIARSAEDNYTPGLQVDWIQGRVVDVVKSVYCDDSDGESGLVIHDLCEDAHRKCATLFRMKRHLTSDPLPVR